MRDGYPLSSKCTRWRLKMETLTQTSVQTPDLKLSFLISCLLVQELMLHIHLLLLSDLIFPFCLLFILFSLPIFCSSAFFVALEYWAYKWARVTIKYRAICSLLNCFPLIWLIALEGCSWGVINSKVIMFKFHREFTYKTMCDLKLQSCKLNFVTRFFVCVCVIF